MDKEILIAGSLMESAASQLKLAEKAIERMDTFSRSLDPTVRQAAGDAASEAVAQAARAEFAQLRGEVQTTLQALKSIRGGMVWNHGVLAAGIASVTVVFSVFSIYAFGGGWAGPWAGSWVPTAATAKAQAQVPTGLRGDPAVLAEIARRGLKVDVSLCGEARRLCVKVDPKAGGQGPRKEFMLVPAQTPQSAAP